MTPETGWGKPTPGAKWHFFRVGPKSGKPTSLCFRYHGRPEALYSMLPKSPRCKGCKQQLDYFTSVDPAAVFPGLLDDSEVQIRLSFSCFCGEGFLLTGKQTLEIARDHVLEHLQSEAEEEK